MDKSDRIRELMGRYLDNSCSREEMEELFEHIRNAPDDENLSEMLEERWTSKDADGLVRQPDWEEMRRHIMKASQLSPHTIGKRRFPWQYAAAVVLVVAIAGFLWFFQTYEHKPNLITSEPALSATSTQTGSRLMVLSDGSTVRLNMGSGLEYEVGFSDTLREVHLTGEAFFDVKHDPERPFIIHTGNIRTTVLGTAFNIRAFPDEEAVTVTVVRGKVRVGDERESKAVLAANQQLLLNRRSRELKQQTVNTEEAIQWTKSDFILDNITFGEAEAIIEARYGVDIVFDNVQLEQCRFTATFYQDADLEQMLTAICMVNKATYDRAGENVIIRGVGCNNTVDQHDN